MSVPRKRFDHILSKADNLSCLASFAAAGAVRLDRIAAAVMYFSASCCERQSRVVSTLSGLPRIWISCWRTCHTNWGAFQRTGCSTASTMGSASALAISPGVSWVQRALASPWRTQSRRNTGGELGSTTSLPDLSGFANR